MNTVRVRRSSRGRRVRSGGTGTPWWKRFLQGLTKLVLNLGLVVLAGASIFYGYQLLATNKERTASSVNTDQGVVGGQSGVVSGNPVNTGFQEDVAAERLRSEFAGADRSVSDFSGDTGTDAADALAMSENAPSAAGNELLAELTAVPAESGTTVTAPDSAPASIASRSVSRQDRATPVGVAQLEILDQIKLERQFPGQLEARQTSRLAFEFGGYMRTVNVDEGDSVEKDQALAVLDQNSLNAERLALLASRDAINAQLTLAQIQLDRTERLRNSGAVSVDQKDQAVAGRDELIARKSEVGAQLRQIRIQMDKATLLAPFSGIVGARHIDPGNTVGAGEPVLTLYEDSSPTFRVGLPPDLDPTAFESTEVEIDGRSYPVTLRAVRPDIDSATRMRTVLFDIQGEVSSGFGQTGTLRTTVARNITGAWISLDAMRPGVGEIWTILTLDASNIARTVAVEPLYIGSDRALIMGAFQNGDRVIVRGAHKISAGQLVDPV